MNVPMDDWMRLVQAEYLEMPGLNLTKRQARRLWGLDPKTCDEVLDALESASFLKETPDHGYVLAGPSR
jgi:hypothetical protein